MFDILVQIAQNICFSQISKIIGDILDLVLSIIIISGFRVMHSN